VTAGTAPPSEVAAYLTRVRDALGDLPPGERDDLVAEVEASLVEAAAEGGAIAARLGPPEEFAAELRAAAGLHETSPPPSRRDSQLFRRLRALGTGVVRDPRVAALVRLGRELAPIWWVARAYFAVGAVAYAVNADCSTRYPILPHLGGSGGTGLLLIALAIVVSIWLGLRARRSGPLFPRASAVLNALLVLAIVPTVAEVTNTRAFDMLLAAAYAPPPEAAVTTGLWNGGVRVDNIYPFSRDGKLLHDVLLYDGAGRPLEIPTARGLDPDRRYVVTNGNKPLFNVFPIRYYEPGTRRVERPNAVPYVELPLVLTPPLPAKRQPR
jgi:hypothetical protein